jgi:hypothetical protein
VCGSPDQAAPTGSGPQPAHPGASHGTDSAHTRPGNAVGALLHTGLTTGSPGGYDTGARGPADVDPGREGCFHQGAPESRRHPATDRPDRRGPQRSPEQRPPVVTEAIGPFEGVEAARQPRASRTVSCFSSCSQRDSKPGQGRHPGPSPASMAHTRESYGYICTL